MHRQKSKTEWHICVHFRLWHILSTFVCWPVLLLKFYRSWASPLYLSVSNMYQVGAFSPPHVHTTRDTHNSFDSRPPHIVTTWTHVEKVVVLLVLLDVARRETLRAIRAHPHELVVLVVGFRQATRLIRVFLHAQIGHTLVQSLVWHHDTTAKCPFSRLKLYTFTWRKLSLATTVPGRCSFV